MKVYEGSVLTCDKNNTVAKCLVEENGKIVYVGDNLPEQYKDVEIVELGEK